MKRYEVNDEWAHSGMIRAGDFCFLSYCVGRKGDPIEAQINGAFDMMERRLAYEGLTLADVVQMDCLFKNIWDIPAMEKVIRDRFGGRYPVRKSIQTAFADEDTLLFQADAIAYAPPKTTGGRE